MLHSDSIAQVAAALVAAQAKLKDVTRDKTARVQSQKGTSYSYDYADLATVLDAIRPVLTENKLAVTQFAETGNGEDDRGVAVTTLLLHESGEYIGGKLVMPCDMGNAQSIGSAITYGRRYGLQCVVGIATESDDDGAGAKRPQQTRPAQTRPPQQQRTEASAESEGPDPRAVAVMDVLRSQGKETKGQQMAALAKVTQALGLGLPTGGNPEAWLSEQSDHDIAKIVRVLGGEEATE